MSNTEFTIKPVSNGLFRSAHPTSITPLIDNGIQVCVDLETILDDTSPAEALSLADAGIEMIRTPIGDFSGTDWTYLGHILALIVERLKAGKKVLVHCSHGVDRSGMICCMYRIEQDKWRVDQAVQEWIDMGMHKFPYASWPLNWPDKLRKRYS